jgi:hypothetical protein
MPQPTYTALATVTLGASASSVTFSSIPATYRDLILVHNGTSSNASVNTVLARLNADTGSNFFQVAMNGDGSSTSSFTFTGTGVSAGFTRSTELSVNITQIMDYSATDKHKTALSRHNNSAVGAVRAAATRWANTAAVSSIVLVIDTGATFSSGTTFSLYGVIA